MTAVVWPAPQIPGTGGCLPCDWVPTGPVPAVLQASMAPASITSTCAGTCHDPTSGFGQAANCPGFGAGSLPAIMSINFVGGSYDSTKYYSNGYAGCTNTLSSLTWLGNASFLFDVWADYRAGLWTGVLEINIYCLWDSSLTSCSGTPGSCPTHGFVPDPGSCAGTITFTSAFTFNVAGGPTSATTTTIGGASPICPPSPYLVRTIYVYDDGTVTVS